MNQTNAQSSSPAVSQPALRAANELNERFEIIYQDALYDVPVEKLAEIIDRNTGVSELLEALRDAEIAMRGAGAVKGNRAAEDHFCEVQLRVRAAIEKAEGH
jgi:DNA-binding transcriptional regulator LsrR (DeoR family)